MAGRSKRHQQTMISSDTLFGIFLTIQTGVGFIGNALLFTFYMYIFLILPHQKKPADGILAHLTLANALTLIFRCMPHIIFSFGIRPALDDIGCKIVLYVQRVTRGISLNATSLQSTFQAVTIAPHSCKWSWLKKKISALIHPSLLFFWVMNMVMYSYFMVNIVARGNVTHATCGYYTQICRVMSCDHQGVVISVSAIFIQDLFFLFLMAWNSVYMMTVLSRHHKTAQHVRSRTSSSRSSPEHKATHIVLILVCCFVFCHWSNIFLLMYTELIGTRSWQLENINNFISSFYPTIVPFILIKNENRISGMNFISTRSRVFSP
ncbi:vomeronasal type-1 receptor 1-like [Pteronotus mesoamericanus]|uniref:vomeronasal type-1 receptor 1-like n=1 Tax=Pteronotus mesoamericanus TaxID=1884717 RepID=UPI0023EB28DA|nr:vomeronasal type-1 receptor 1-like [Pteronotus parnellii mesoamericanus]